MLWTLLTHHSTWLLTCFVSVVVITCASHAQGRRFEPGTKQVFCTCPKPCPAPCRIATCPIPPIKQDRFYGVMVSTLDFESSDPSSNLGRTLHCVTPWRNGSASDSRSEGCVFESRRGQQLFLVFFPISKRVCLQ